MVCQSYKKLNKIFDYIWHVQKTSKNPLSEDEFKASYAMYIGDNPSDHARTGVEKRYDLENVAESWSKLKFLAYTSTICIGVDYNVRNHFNSIIGVYSGEQGLNADLFVQGLLRVRNPSATTHTLFMKNKDNVLSDKCSPYPTKCHKELRKTLSSHYQLLDSISNTFNGLKYTLIARNNLIHRYGQDWIINTLSSIGFNFNFMSLEGFIESHGNKETLPDTDSHKFEHIHITYTDILDDLIKKYRYESPMDEGDLFEEEQKLIKKIKDICPSMEEYQYSAEREINPRMHSYIQTLFFNVHISPEQLDQFNQAEDQEKYLKDIQKYSFPAIVYLLKNEDIEYKMESMDDVLEHLCKNRDIFIHDLIENFQ